MRRGSHTNDFDHVPSRSVERNRRATIEDVAARAGVHTSTVSRALNRPELVSPATRDRVKSIADELGFVPNRAARGLITGRTGNVALIAPDITNPHFTSLVRGAGQATRELDLQLLLVDTGEHPDEEVRAARTLAPEVDGLVVLSARKLHRTLDVLGSTDVVFVDRPVKGRASVVMRAGAATEEAVQHLAALGHRELAYLPGPRASWAAGERLRAVQRASKKAAVDFHVFPVATPTFEAATAVVDDVLATDATAVLAFNDQMALGVISALAERRIRVPGDVSVIGCDDVPMATMTSPALTTIRMPAGEAGARAVQMLHRPAQVASLAAEFVIRGSTGSASTRSARSDDPRP